MKKILFQGRTYTVIREIEEYYACQLSDTEIEFIIKKADANIVDENAVMNA